MVGHLTFLECLIDGCIYISCLWWITLGWNIKTKCKYCIKSTLIMSRNRIINQIVHIAWLILKWMKKYINWKLIMSRNAVVKCAQITSLI